MIVPRQPDAPIEELSKSASNPEYTTTCDSQQTWNFTLEATQSNFEETGPLELPTHTFSQDIQLSEYGIFNATCDPPMSFRDRHRFLDGVYNSYPDPVLITAEEMGDVARKVGLLMEEVLLWFKDEKLRRAELLARNPRQAQKSACQFPPSPESIRGSGEVSSASSSYNATSPGTPSKPEEISSPCSASADQKILAPPKAKRGRPAKMHVKLEPDLPSPDTKRKKISVKYPCPDCQNFVPVERWAEHINRKHFPKHVWECPKTNRQTGNPCSSSPHYRPAYRDDNFATHLKGEHKCPDAEVAELKETCKFEVKNFFHKICGFCNKSLDSRDESIEHIKDHFRKASEEPNAPVDLGVSLWKEKCGVEHNLKLGIHYRRSQTSEPHPTDEDEDAEGKHDRDEDENGGSGKGIPDNSGHDNSDFRSNNNSHDRDTDENGASGDGNSDNPCHDSSSSQPNNNSHTHDHGEDTRSSQDSSDNSGDPRNIDATSSQDQPSIGRLKMDFENAPNVLSISLLGWNYDRRLESQERDTSSSQAPRSPTGIPCTKTPRLTPQKDADFQCHVEGCGKLFSRSYNFKAHLETHDETREHLFPCSIKDCDKKFEKKTDLERHHQSAHVVQRNRCEYCSRTFASEDILRRHMENGCSKRCDVETSVGVSIDYPTFHPFLSHTSSCMEEEEFPLYPDPETMFRPQGPREAYPKMAWFNSNTIYAEAPQNTMESPELRAPSTSSTESGASARSSALDSPYSIRTPELGTPSKYSTASGLPAVPSSSIGSPHSIHGHIVSGPEWATQTFGLNPSIVVYDNLPPRNEYTFSVGSIDEIKLDFNPPKHNGIFDPYIIHPQNTGHRASAAYSNHNSYPYPPPSVTSGQSQSSQADFSSEQYREKGRCTYPDCGKVFQDLKAHMLTHQNERPEKCPIQTCEYHIKGFARKYDKNRHTLTHYKGTMVCGFCPGNDSAAEKSFNRADIFKRHLTRVHAVEQTPPNSRKKTSRNINSAKKLSDYALDATGKCSTCSETFGNPQDFYEHLDDCVLRIVQQEKPSEAINAVRLAEVEKDQSVSLRNNALPTTTTSPVMNEDEDDEEFDDNDDYTLRSRNNRPNSLQRIRELTRSKWGVTLNTKGRKKRKDYPSSWGFPASKMRVKKQVPCVFDGPRQLLKDDMIFDTDYEVRMKLSDKKAYVNDLDVQTMRRAGALQKSTREEKGPGIVDDDLTGMYLEKLMKAKG